MIDTNQNHLTDCVPQQEADYARPVGVASPASCNRIMRLPEVMTRVGLKRATVYLHINRGSFPKPISLGPRAVGWLEGEIDAWIAARIEVTRRGNQA